MVLPSSQQYSCVARFMEFLIVFFVGRSWLNWLGQLCLVGLCTTGEKGRRGPCLVLYGNVGFPLAALLTTRALKEVEGRRA